MKAEKTLLIDDLLRRVNASPFLLVVDYTGLKVDKFAELRKRLRGIGAALKRFAVLCLGWTPEAAVVCAWTASGVDVLGVLPAARARPRVIAVCAGAPAVKDRLQWIRAGTLGWISSSC